MLFHKSMFIAIYVIASIYSNQWLGSCFELTEDDSNTQNALETIDLNETELPYNKDEKSGFEFSEYETQFAPFSETNETAEGEDAFLKLEPVISDPLVEEILPNSSVFSELKMKRHIPETGFDHDGKMKILQLHNLYRSNVTPPAGNMEFLEWDDELEDLAKQWADGCVFEHGMPENDYPETIGQNLYIGSDPTGYLGLWMWYQEYHDYDLRKEYCLPNRVCGHYVQMAWAASHRLGCAMKKCKERYFVVCHYSPQALRGVSMYRVAKPCSQCTAKNGALCVRNLCITKEQCKRNPFQCKFAKCDLHCHNCGKLDKEHCRCECADGWDSPDCSQLCADKHSRCGKSPGFPSKAACSLNRHAVGDIYCRKMCERCNGIDENLSNYTCCNGLLCPEGHVLTPDSKECQCSMLCPGPICDAGEENVLNSSYCDGLLCPDGYVPIPYNKKCKCSSLCPGPMCGGNNESFSNSTYCDGFICPEGYVSIPHDKKCKCFLLCPGPLCDGEEKVMLSVESSSCRYSCPSYLLLFMILLFFIQKESMHNSSFETSRKE